MHLDALKQLYASKTDDELLVIAGDRTSLVPEAQIALADELTIRGLIWPRRQPVPTESRDAIHLDQNPAFNTAAKVGGLLLFLFAAGTGAAYLGWYIYYEDWRGDIASLVVGLVLVLGIFGSIIWATRRHLRRLQRLPKNQRR